MSQKKFKYVRVIVFGLLAVLVLSIAHLSLHTKAHAQSKSSAKPAVAISAAKLATLGNTINAVINANPNIDVGVSLIDTNTGHTFQYGVTDPFEAASTAKLITAADYLHNVEKGNASLGQNIDGSSAQYELRQMIEMSDDTSWLSLNDYLGHPELLAYGSQIGLSNYTPDDNTLTTHDIALLLDKLYKGQLLNKTDTQLLLSYMAVANYNGYIAAVVPPSVKLYHKAGVLDDRIHDAAILTSQKRSVILVVFTKNEDDQYSASPDQVTIIQQIATAVLNTYFK